jgi:hypothetical protein
MCKDEYEEFMDEIRAANYCACEYYKHLNIILSDFGSVFYPNTFIVNDNSCVIFIEDFICDECMSELIVTDQIRKEF